MIDLFPGDVLSVQKNATLWVQDVGSIAHQSDFFQVRSYTPWPTKFGHVPVPGDTLLVISVDGPSSSCCVLFNDGTLHDCFTRELMALCTTRLVKGEIK